MLNDVDNKNMNIYYDCIISKKEKEKYKQNLNIKLNHTMGPCLNIIIKKLIKPNIKIFKLI